MTDDADLVAQTILDLVSVTADRQVSREIAHLAEIVVDTSDPGNLAPPAGHRAPTGGAVTTHVLATSRSAVASVEMRVTVWPADNGTQFTVVRAGSDRTLEVALDEVQPEPTPKLHDRVNAYVATIIAAMLTQLNVAEQRTHLPHTSSDDVGEYSED